jgi:hypothetical protein
MSLAARSTFDCAYDSTQLVRRARSKERLHERDASWVVVARCVDGISAAWAECFEQRRAIRDGYVVKDRQQDGASFGLVARDELCIQGHFAACDATKTRTQRRVRSKATSRQGSARHPPGAEAPMNFGGEHREGACRQRRLCRYRGPQRSDDRGESLFALAARKRAEFSHVFIEREGEVSTEGVAYGGAVAIGFQRRSECQTIDERGRNHGFHD